MNGYGLISMKGSAGGTARLYPQGEAQIILRGRIMPARAYFIDLSGNISSCPVGEDGRCKTDTKGVCAVAVFDGTGSLICSGAMGACGKRLYSLLPELSIRAVSETNNTEVTAPQQNKGEGLPASPVTQSILSKAKSLFAEEAAEEAPPEQDRADTAARQAVTAIPNPFPRTYPDSYWQTRQGSDMLFGVAETPRGRLIVRAVAVKNGARRLGFERYLTDVNGRAYRAHEQLQKR